jgi:hypothetical protein
MDGGQTNVSMIDFEINRVLMMPSEHKNVCLQNVSVKSLSAIRSALYVSALRCLPRSPLFLHQRQHSCHVGGRFTRVGMRLHLVHRQ